MSCSKIVQVKLPLVDGWRFIYGNKLWSYSSSRVCFFHWFVLILVVLEEAIQKANGEEIVIPFGVGIAGTVAQTKNIVNIRNAYEDPRFNCEIDQKTGYKTKNILSMPICNYEGDVIGVAQIINKTTGKQSAY